MNKTSDTEDHKDNEDNGDNELVLCFKKIIHFIKLLMCSVAFRFSLFSCFVSCFFSENGVCRFVLFFSSGDLFVYFGSYVLVKVGSQVKQFEKRITLKLTYFSKQT